jgi:IS30 family transposase
VIFYNRQKTERITRFMSLFDYTIHQVKNQSNDITKKQYVHLKEYDRKNIEYFLSKGYNYSQIARELGVHRSTISREVKRGLWNYKTDASGRHYRYQYDVAQTQAQARMMASKRKPKLNRDSLFLVTIVKLIKRFRISLFQATELIKENQAMFDDLQIVSLPTLYKYAKKGILNLKNTYFPYGLKYQTHRDTKKPKSLQKGVNISKRPEEANKRTVFGHWEGDLVVGPRKTSHECLFTLAERKTRVYLAFKIPNKSSEAVKVALDNLEHKLGTHLFKTIFKSITFDNGKEFARFEDMERSIDSESKRFNAFFANAYHSWERGTNEVSNRWIRRFFPKGTDFSLVTQDEINEAISRINFTKRKLLNNQSSSALLDELKIPLLDILGIFNPFQNVKKILFQFGN